MKIRWKSLCRHGSQPGHAKATSSSKSAPTVPSSSVPPQPVVTPSPAPMVPMQPLYVQSGAFLPMSYLPSQLPFVQEPLSAQNGLVGGGQDSMVVMSEGRNRGMNNSVPVQPMRRMGSSNVSAAKRSEA